MITASEFRTDRLLLLPLEVKHATEMTTVLSDPELYRFTGGEPPAAEELAARYQRQVAGPGWLNWVVSDGVQLVGYVQATVTGEQAEVAWVIGTEFQGNGYAKEAAQGLVKWLGSQGIAQVVCHIHPDHAASEAIAGAVGFTRTEVMVDGEYQWTTR